MLPEATWVRPPARGRLHRARRALQAATSLVFVVAPFVGLLRFDLRRGALVLAGASFGLGDLQAVYLLILLFILVVFAGALLYGRIYCGWMCPQTTLSEIVATFERWASRRVKAPGLRRALPAVGALGMSAFVAASLVSYFLDPAELLSPPRLALVSWGITTAVIGGFLLLRHRFCIGVCPYGILQNIIQDSRTLGVELDPRRREECVDCLLCVRACFVGVDIRANAFDPRCLNCGDCISATRLAKRCPERPLIRFRYGTEPSRWPSPLRRVGVSDARRAVVVAAVMAMTGVTAVKLAGRHDLDADVAAQYERATHEGELVRNVYRLTLRNRRDAPVRLHLEAEGPPGLRVEPPADLRAAAGEQAIRDLVLSAPCGGIEAGAHEVRVRVVPEGPAVPVELPTVFFVPSRRSPCAGSSVSPLPRSSESSPPPGSHRIGPVPSSSTSTPPRSS
jgi:polyferredoxin